MNQDLIASEYATKGYVLVRSLIGADEVTALQAECQRVWEAADLSVQNLRTAPRVSIEGGTRVDRLDPVRDISPLIDQLVGDPRLLAAAAAALGEPALLFKDKLLYKPAGVHGYTVHQDYHYWQELPAPGEAMVSIGLAVDASHAGNGAVRFYPGLHDRLHTAQGRPSDVFNPNKGVMTPDMLGGIASEMIPLEPGDAVVFSSLTPHESAPNYTGEPRRMLYLSYSAARYGSLYEEYYSSFRSYRKTDSGAADGQEQYFR